MRKVTYIQYKKLLKSFGCTNFRGVRKSITTIDGTLVTVTRFICTNRKGQKIYGAVEPETGFYEIDYNPIGEIS